MRTQIYCWAVLACGVVFLAAPAANAQGAMGFSPSDAHVDGMPIGSVQSREIIIDQRLTEHRIRGRALKQELRKLRATYFRNVRNVQIRQAGIDRLKSFTDPASFELLLDVFKHDGEDVREAIIDHLASIDTDESIATLAWAAVFDDDEDITKLAADRVNGLTAKMPAVPMSVQSVVAMGLQSPDSDAQAAAATMAADLSLYEAVPMMIHAQVNPGRGGGGGGGGTGTGAIAQILVGTQVAYVSDLEPVVGDSAVGFDPELSVVTEGVYLRVSGVAVIFYNVDVHTALRRLTSAGWSDDSTRRLGWDVPAWHEWTEREYEPRIAGLVQSELDRRERMAAGTNATVVPNSDGVVPPMDQPIAITPDLDVPVPPENAGPGGGPGGG